MKHGQEKILTASAQSKLFYTCPSVVKPKLLKWVVAVTVGLVLVIVASMRGAAKREAAVFYNLGVCYAVGIGTPTSDTEAVKWFRKAAEKGHADAQFILAYYLSFWGKGMEKPNGPESYYDWLKKAMNQGHANAQFFNGIEWRYSEDGPKIKPQYDYEAAEMFKKAAKKGHVLAQVELADCYLYGEGVGEDHVVAVEWLRKAAAQECPEAQYVLGMCYYNGYGVGEDYAEAVAWYRKVAEHGHAGAQAMLGRCYYKGQGVVKDDAEATRWLQKAIGQGHAGARVALGTLTGDGDDEMAALSDDDYVALRDAAGQDIPEAQFKFGMHYHKDTDRYNNYLYACKWLRRAAEQGDADAQYNLARWFFQSDVTGAAKWYRKAAEQGHAEAQAALETLAKNDAEKKRQAGDGK